MSLTEQCRQMSQNEIAQHIQTLLPMIKHEDSISVKRQLQIKSEHSFPCGADKRSTKKFNSTYVKKQVTMVLTGLFTKHEMQQNKNQEMLETITNTSIEAIVDVKTEDHIVLHIPFLQLFVRATPYLSYRLLHDSVKSHRSIHLNKRALQTLAQSSNPSKQVQFQQLKEIVFSSRYCINNTVDSESAGSGVNGSDGGSDSSYCESYIQPMKRLRSSSSGSIKSETISKRPSAMRKPFQIKSEQLLAKGIKQEARGSNVLKVRHYETLSLRQRHKYDRFVTCRVGSFVEYYARGLYTRTQVTGLTATDFEILNTSKIEATVVLKNADGLVLHIADTGTLHYLTTSQVGYYVNTAKRCTLYTEKSVQPLAYSRNSSSNNIRSGFRHSDSSRDVVRWRSLERLIYNSTRRISESQLSKLRRQIMTETNDYSANDVDDNGEFIIYDSESDGGSDSGCSDKAVVMTADDTPLSSSAHPDDESISLVSTKSVKSEPLHIVSSDSHSDTGSDVDTDSCDDSVIISQESKYQRGFSGKKRKCNVV